MNVYVYTVEGLDDGEAGEFTTDPSFTPQPGLGEAEAFASERGLRVIEHVYHWADSELVRDYGQEGESCSGD